MNDNTMHDDVRDTRTRRVLPLVLAAAVACGQAVYLFASLYPQRAVFQDYGPYETMFVSSEITILSFELFYLFLLIYGLLRKTSALRMEQAERITVILFDAFLILQTFVNTLCASLDVHLLLFIVTKALCTMALFALIESVKGGRVRFPSAGNANDRKRTIVTTFLLFSFFYSILVFFMITDVYAFVYTIGHVYLAFVFVCVVFYLFRNPKGKMRFFDRIMLGLRFFLPFLLILYSVLVFPLLLSQHHRTLNVDCSLDEVDEVLQNAEVDDRNVIVCETDDLYIFFPLYHDIRFIAGSRPSKADEENVMVIPTAFHHNAFELGYSVENIEGIFVDEGSLYRGGNLASAGAFTYVDGTGEIWSEDEAKEALDVAAKEGGSGYQQFVMLKDGEVIYMRKGRVCYRTVAIWKDRVCVVATKRKTLYAEFLDMLKDLGIEDAIYCDVGTGWNYSWYRTNDGGTKDLFGIPWPFSHAWLVFKK